ncbi:MAG: class I SAM-dependent RNA methyltransferase [Nitriliruptoraceae bacterium]
MTGEHEVFIDGFTHGGEGVARIDGKAVFVAGAIPGERVRIRVVDDRKRWARAHLLTVIEANDDRVEPPCVYASECGGCDLQHVRPSAQRALKTRVVREQLQRIGGIAAPPVDECRAVGPDLGYRTHAQFHVAPDGRLGFRRTASHEVVAVDECIVVNAAVQRVADQVAPTSAAKAAVRAHPSTDTAAVVLTPGREGLDVPGGEFDVLLEQPDGRTVRLRGDGVLRERVAGADFTFGASSFFQVNTAGATALVDAVHDAIGTIDGDLVWDLYAGVGLLSIPLAAAGADVIAVESDSGAVADAETNAVSNGVVVDVIHDDVAEVVARAANGDRAVDLPDVVVLDPPRSGAGPATAANLAALAPGRIIYVACDVAALARDARVLEEHGYRLRNAVPLDLFPMTHHVEVVATFAP